MIKYLGSKRLFVPVIGGLLDATGAQSALDLFTGTTRVAQEFCRRGAFTYAVDTATYSEVLAQCYVEIDSADIDQDEVELALRHLSSLPPKRGYFTRVFCEESRYFHPDNGVRIDAIRDGIDEYYADSPLRPILLTSLLEAADAVDSTVGLQMAYLKQWAPRALKPLELRSPVLTPGRGSAIRGSALEVATMLPHVDFAYLDPPYNQHRYFTNYHVWETLIRNDEPEYYGIACKRTDARDEKTKSPFNQRGQIGPALEKILRDLDASTVALSFSDEGFLPLEQLVEYCEARGGTVEVLEFENKRHVGAQIGIHNLDGKKVGTPGPAKNLEYIILQGDAGTIRAMVDGVAPRTGSQLP
ncbi:DNA adenine methylase [Actinomycetaceae bacterium MB13-C1-2]|nr:DNA adenine methylase [Actinomycetaceae bacterium MB13-C1-2]